MKLPFYTVIGPIVKKHYRDGLKICSWPLLQSLRPWYIIFISVVGIFFTLFDIVQMMNRRLDECKEQVKQDSDEQDRTKTRTLPRSYKRDLKLITSAITLEYHVLVLLGVFTGNPVFFMPWLLLQGFIITLECLIFILRLICSGIYMNRQTVVSMVITSLHWIIILCFFASKVNRCDI